MHRVAEATLGALTHEHLPFAKVVEKLQPKRKLDHNPLFQVWFVLQSGAAERRDFTGLQVEDYPIDSEVTRHDLQLSVWQSSSVLKAAFTYNTDIFDSQTAAHMADQFLLLLATASERPDVYVSDLRSMLKRCEEEFKKSREQDHENSVRRKLQSARRKSLILTSVK